MAELRAAERAAPDWSTIHLEAGATFRGDLYIDNDKLRIVGDATIKGGVTITADYTTLKGMTIIDAPRSGVSVSGAKCININDVEVAYSDWHGVYTYRADNVTVQNCDIHDNAQEGYAAGVSFHVSVGNGYMRILNSRIHDNGLETSEKEAWGVILDQDHWRRGLPDYHGTTTIKGNTFTGNGGAGFLAFHASDVDFLFNRVAENYATGARAAGAEVRFLNSTHNNVVGNDILTDHRAFLFEAGATAKMHDNTTGTLADPHHDGGALHDDHWMF
jgi:hypothetical protein